MSLRMPRLVVPAWPRRRPAFMVVVPVVFIIVILHLTGPVTPALATDLVAFGLAALADRWLVASGVGVGVMLVVTLLLPSGWPTLAEYASLIPLAVALLQRRSRPALAFGLGYLVINSWPSDLGAELLRNLSLWVVAYAVLWASVELWNSTIEARDRTAKAQLRQQRHAIARDLHDTFAHELCLMSMQVQRAGIRGRLELGDLDSMLETCDAAITQLRGILVLMRLDDSATVQPITQRRDLDAACQEAVTRLSRHGFTAEYSCDGSVDDVGATAQWALAGICHEAASNVIRHGDPAGVVMISIDTASDSAEAQLALSNQVLAGHRPAGHATLGLIGMRERVEAVGGRLHTSLADDQWLTLACVPRRRNVVVHPQEPA